MRAVQASACPVQPGLGTRTAEDAIVSAAEPVPPWEQEVIARERQDAAVGAAVRAARAILDAHDRAILEFTPAYLADTLRMVLGVLDDPRGEAP
jgi:hypothetical protein